MAPAKGSSVIPTKNTLAKTRAKTGMTIGMGTRLARAKRKASPLKEMDIKRSALGELNINLNSQNKIANDKSKADKKPVAQTKRLPTVKTVMKPKQNENVGPPAAPVAKIQTRAAVRNTAVNHTALKSKESNQALKDSKVKTRLSNEFEKTEDSLYCSALEDIDVSAQNSVHQSRTRSRSLNAEKANVSLVAKQFEEQLILSNTDVPDGVNDFDKENWNDIFQASHYTMDIFNYLKSREPTFEIKDYMPRQVCVTSWMRSLLVDWMVEIQESFELNHETLYLGVKLVDLYLSKVVVSKETLQLIGAASMFIASKFDERIPPLLDNFLYICDGAYSRKELLRMEINLLKVCGFDLGIPLSYRFLRRYARCAKISMPILTLARYILEYSLMDYATITVLDSKLAAAALYLALQMKKVGGWNETLQFYSGYKLENIITVAHLLNNGLHRRPREQLSTIRNKYSHKIFFEVAKTPLLMNDQLKP